MLFFFSKEKIEEIKQLESKLPNDMLFGEALRSKFGSEKFALETPNDQELGVKIRRIIKNL